MSTNEAMTLGQVRDDILRLHKDRPDLEINIWADAIDAHLAKVPDVRPLGYFAADPGEGNFERCATLDEAKLKAEGMLEDAGDAAADWFWTDDPPQICYGIVLAGCEEASREPAPEGSDFEEFVNYRLNAAPTHPDTVKEGEPAMTFDEYAELNMGRRGPPHPPLRED